MNFHLFGIQNYAATLYVHTVSNLRQGHKNKNNIPNSVLCVKSGFYNRKKLIQSKVGNYFWQTYVRLRIYGYSHLPYQSRYMYKISENRKRLFRLGNYDPRNLLVGSLFLLKTTSLSKGPPSPWLRHPPKPQIKNIKVNIKVIAQGSRRYRHRRRVEESIKGDKESVT